MVVAAGLLAIIGVGGVAAATGQATVVKTANNKTWGKILVLGNGDALYRLSADHRDKSVCTGLCATIWPPVTLAKGQRSPVGRGVKGLGAITRPGGARQVTLDGDPLYRFSGDRKPGQTNGNDLTDTWGHWSLIDPAHPQSPPVRAHTTAKHSTKAKAKAKAKHTTTTTHSSGGGYGGGYNY